MTNDLRHSSVKGSSIKKFKTFNRFLNLIKKYNFNSSICRKRQKQRIKKELLVQSILENLKDPRKQPRGFRYGRNSDLLHNGTFHEAIGPVLVMAQCFCLMPVRGILSKTAKGLSFCWISFRTSYCLLYVLTTILDMLLVVNMIMHDKLNVKRIEPFIFHLSILLAAIGFLRLASKWPKLMKRWQEVEKQLPPFDNWREREYLSKRITMATFVLITLSLTEHLLSIISAIHFANYCPATSDPIESFFLSAANQIFFVFDYSPWLALAGKIQNILLTFGWTKDYIINRYSKSPYFQKPGWTYMDVFVSIIGMGVSSLFKRLQCNLEKYQGLSMSESFWVESRCQYSLICDLIEEVDEAVSGITMLSFANNLYFVCIQCLKSTSKMPSFAHAVYFYFSLLFLLGRTLAVSLYLAEVNDRSREPLSVIKQVPAETYYPEVDRFAFEINVSVVAMTGMQYFDITRKLVLSVAGTIVTYELVLIQFLENEKLWNCGN